MSYRIQPARDLPDLIRQLNDIETQRSNRQQAAIASLATTATLAQVIAKVNEILTALREVEIIKS